MRISDWSSDVCSSELRPPPQPLGPPPASSQGQPARAARTGFYGAWQGDPHCLQGKIRAPVCKDRQGAGKGIQQSGRASGREREGEDGENPVVAVTIKIKQSRS